MADETHDATFREEQDHLSTIYAQLCDLRDTLTEEMKTSHKGAADDLREISEEIRPTLAAPTRPWRHSPPSRRSTRSSTRTTSTTTSPSRSCSACSCCCASPTSPRCRCASAGGRAQGPVPGHRRHLRRELPAHGGGLAQPRGRGVLQPGPGPHLLRGRRAHHRRGPAVAAPVRHRGRRACAATSTATWPSRTRFCWRRSRATPRRRCRPSRPPSSASRTSSSATRTCPCCWWRHRRIGQDLGAAPAHRLPVLPQPRHPAPRRGVPLHAQPRVQPLHRERPARPGRAQPAHPTWGEFLAPLLPEGRGVGEGMASLDDLARIDEAVASFEFDPRDFAPIVSAGVTLVSADAAWKACMKFSASRPGRTG